MIRYGTFNTINTIVLSDFIIREERRVCVVNVVKVRLFSVNQETDHRLTRYLVRGSLMRSGLMTVCDKDRRQIGPIHYC